MSRERRPAKSQPNSVIPTQWAILIAIVAFSAGAGTSWLLLQSRHGNSSGPHIPTYGASSPTVTGRPSVSMAPPDVSQLAPADAAMALGNWNYDRQAWREAIDAYLSAISLGADNPNVRTDLGNAFRFSGEPDKALEQYQIARKQNPLHEYSLINMANLYSQVLRDPANALISWREYLRLFPTGEKAAFANQFILTESLKEP